MTDKECPECKTIVPMCSCGEWDCGFYYHLRVECPSARGDEYRKQCEFSKEFGEALDAKDKDRLRAVSEKYPDLFKQRMEKLRARYDNKS